MNNENLLDNLEEILTNIEALNVFLVLKGIKKGAYINVKPQYEERLDNLLRENSVFFKKIQTKLKTNIGKYIAYFISKKQNPNKLFRNNTNLESGFFDKLVGLFLGFEAIYDMKNEPCKNGFHIAIKAYERKDGGNRLRNIISQNYNGNGIKNYSILDFCWIENFDKIKEKMLPIRQYYEDNLQTFFTNRFFVKLFIVK